MKLDAYVKSQCVHRRDLANLIRGCDWTNRSDDKSCHIAFGASDRSFEPVDETGVASGVGHRCAQLIPENRFSWFGALKAGQVDVS